MAGNNRVQIVTAEIGTASSRSHCTAAAGVAWSDGTIRYREFCAGAPGPDGPDLVTLLLRLNEDDAHGPAPGPCARGDVMHAASGLANGLGAYVAAVTAEGIRFACLRGDDAWVGWDCSAPLVAGRLRTSQARIAELLEEVRASRASLHGLSSQTRRAAERIRSEARRTFGSVHRAVDDERRMVAGESKRLDGLLEQVSQSAANLELPQYRINLMAVTPRQVLRGLGNARNQLDAVVLDREEAARALPGQQAWSEQGMAMVEHLERALREATAARDLLARAHDAARMSVRLPQRRGSGLRQDSRESASLAADWLHVARASAGGAPAPAARLHLLDAAETADAAGRRRNIAELCSVVALGVEAAELAMTVVKLELLAARASVAAAAGRTTRTGTEQEERDE